MTTVVEIVLPECDQLDCCFNGVDDVEGQVDWGDDSRNIGWFIGGSSYHVRAKLKAKQMVLIKMHMKIPFSKS